MSRKKTARQVRRRRMFFRAIFVTFTVAVLGTGAFLLIKNPLGTGESRKNFMPDPYESRVELKTLEIRTEETRPPLFGSGLCVAEESEPDGRIDAAAGIVFNRTTGEAVYSHNAYRQLYPASVTKCMTFLTALRYGDLAAKVTVTEEMLANLDPASSVAGLKPGDTLTLDQLLYGLMMPSGNDAANAIAWLVAGGEEEFVALMNEEARAIGATGSHFSNAHGLTDPEHYTTAYDIYLIYNELLDYDKFLEVIGTPDYMAQYENAGVLISTPWTRGIWYFNGRAEAPEGITPIGGKTGTTPEAGYCLSLASVDPRGEQYVSVVLKAENRDDLYENMTALLSKIQK